jgi:hypothetical protein
MNHGFQVGPSNGAHMAFDTNEIQARDNGTYANLYLNFLGGGVYLGQPNVGDGSKTTIYQLLEVKDNNSTNSPLAEITVTGTTAGYVRAYGNTQAATPTENYTQIVGRSSSSNSNCIFARVANVDRFEARANGNLVISGTLTQGSDIKFKQDITDVDSQWDIIKSIQLKKYRIKEQVSQNPDAPYRYGVIAQDVETVLQNCVEDNKNDEDDSKSYKTFNYVEFHTLAVKALQEAMTRIEQLETQNNNLTEQLNLTLNRITDLESKIQA